MAVPLPWRNVRKADPDTSHKAAFARPGKRQTHKQRCERVLKDADTLGLTDYDLADITGLQQNSIGKRRGELRDEGKVIDSGRTRPGPTGDPCIVWVWVGD